MTLTKRQKVLIGFCAVLLTALIVDWATAGSGLGPEAATASSPAEVGPEMAPLPIPPVETEDIEPAAGISTLADRLEDLAGEESIDAADVGDAFCPPPAWLPRSGAAVVSGNTDGDATRTFAATHELRGVMLDDSTDARAVINDRFLSIGQTIDGYELISVDKHSAVLASDDTQITLKLSGVTNE
jgi:hypothetical protein